MPLIFALFWMFELRSLKKWSACTCKCDVSSVRNYLFRIMSTTLGRFPRGTCRWNCLSECLLCGTFVSSCCNEISLWTRGKKQLPGQLILSDGCVDIWESDFLVHEDAWISSSPRRLYCTCIFGWIWVNRATSPTFPSNYPNTWYVRQAKASYPMLSSKVK